MQFKANITLSVIALSVFILFINLAQWQLSRADEKQSLLDLQAMRMLQKPVSLSNVILDKKQRYLPVKVSGVLDNEHQILISNQVRNGMLGYYVITPLRLEDDQNILINRGWIQATGSLQKLPDIDLPKQQVNLVGKLDTFPSVGILLEGADVPSQDWPSVVQLLKTDVISERLGYPLVPYQLLLESDGVKSYDTQWVAFHMGPEKHLGYAFQWFAMAVALIIIYLVLTISFRKKLDGCSNKK